MQAVLEWLGAKRLGAAFATAGYVLTFAPAQAQSVADFYRSNTLRLTLSSEAGGGFDTIARIVAKYLANHLPGRPNVVVVNMPGGGGTLMANWAYNIAPKDGSAVAMPLSTLPMNQVIAPEQVRYDANKFGWIGNLEQARGVIFTFHSSPTKSIQDAMARETPMAGTGKNSIIYQLLTLSNKLLGTKFKVVLGYNSGRVLAIERGEVDGSASTLENIPALAPQWAEDPHLINMLAVNTEQRLAKYPGVPTLMELVKTPEQRQMLEFWALQSATGRALFAPPGVPADRLDALRRAFDQLVHDQGFIADMARVQSVVEPNSGEEVQASVQRLLATTPEVAAMILDAIK